MAACRAMPPCPRCSERCERAAVNGTPGGAHTSAATSSMAGRITTAENATMLKLYGFSRVNAGARGRTRDLRVLWALEEMQLPFEIAGMDHPAHDLNTEAYRRLSPFEQIPALDDDGQVISESAAIVLHLARKCGRLMPSDATGEAQVLRWCFAAMNTVEPPLLSLMVLDWTADRKSTRLNSSHGYISYAVFCLKKKKNKTQHIPIRYTYE